MKYEISEKMRNLFLGLIPNLDAPGLTYKVVKEIIDELNAAPEIHEQQAPSKPVSEPAKPEPKK